MPEAPEQPVIDKQLGKLPAKSSPKLLHFAKLFPAKTTEPTPPESTKFWGKRVQFAAHSYGNRQHGCCTVASQAVAITRMERLEQRRTITITEDEVLSRYYDLTKLYGGGDTGAYETDALDRWRREELALRDTKGRPYTIDAYIRVDQSNLDEVKRAMAFAGARGFKACYNLPWAWAWKDLPEVWDVPTGQALVGDWLPGSWGGHSTAMWADYNKIGPRVAHTWYDGSKEVSYGIQQLTWAGFAAYCDEAYIVIDSINAWKQRRQITKRQAEIIADAVNQVSSLKVAA